MNHGERIKLKNAAIEKLAQNGVWLARTATLAQIAAQVEIVSGEKRRNSQMIGDYLYRWVGDEHIRINPPYRPPFRPMAAKRHPRADDINRAQPKLWTPKGIGNVKQLGGFIPDVWRL